MFVHTEGITWNWEWRWMETAVIFLATCIYLRGYQKTKTRSKTQNTTFLIGITLLLITIASPFTNIATQLFSMRVLQRILLVALIPLIILSSNPIPTLYAGLPENAQKRLQNLSTSNPNLHEVIRRTTSPAAIWLIFICVFWIGYDRYFHQWTIQSRNIHALEISILFIVAGLYWWHILEVSPTLHEPMPPVVRIGYVLAGAFPIKIIGLVLLFTNSTLYAYPGSIQLGYLSINDQSLGAIFHWSLGGIVFTWTGFYLMRAWFDIEAKKPILPHANWSTYDIMAAPGFDNRVTAQEDKSLPKIVRSNKVPFKPDKESQECQSTRKLSRFTAVPAKIFLIIKSRVVGSHEN